MFKRFFFGIVVRIILLVISVSLFVYTWFQLELIFNVLVFGAISIAVSIELLTYLNRSFRDVQYFLDAIYYDDLSQLPSKKFKDHRLKKLYERLNDIREKYRVKRIDQEENHVFLREVIQTAPIGIISWDEDGKVGIFNHSLVQNIGMEPIKHIDRFSKLRPLLWKQISSIPVGSTGIMKYELDQQEFKLSARKIQIKQAGKTNTLVLVQNIGDVLDQVEIGAWEKLIKILTHELMNGVTIISSLSGTMVDILSAEKVNERDLHRAASAIQKRSKGLLGFVEDYRLLSQIPTPKVSPINMKALLTEMAEIWSSTHSDIVVDISAKGSMNALADSQLFNQVFDNLMLNSAFALKNQTGKKIDVALTKVDGRKIQISFSDNGIGMDEETLSNALVPFYTTRDTGSGIGLALSRQIVRAHNGSLHILSAKNEGTTIIIQIPVG